LTEEYSIIIDFKGIKAVETASISGIGGNPPNSAGDNEGR